MRRGMTRSGRFVCQCGPRMRGSKAGVRSDVSGAFGADRKAPTTIEMSPTVGDGTGLAGLAFGSGSRPRSFSLA